ncbi:MAG: hypothetical protein WCO55_06215 [Candidatus Falkowbacteria bacterium]
MADKILLDNQEYHFSTDALPCLITYAEKSGGSHFSITVLADLFLRGAKVLMLTAYPAAKDNFLEQTQGHENKIIYATDADQLDSDSQAIILESGNERLFMQAILQLPDLKERVVLIKNMEVFSQAVFDACHGLPKLILSGDLDKCEIKDQIAAKKFKAIIAFTKPQTALPIDIPDLEKYTGYLWSTEQQGIVSIEMNNQ